MATGYIWFWVLDVGQGSGNFIEIYDTNNKLTNTILIDLGSEKSMDTAGGPSVDYITKQLKMMDQPTLDATIFSHSDSDHINLMESLLGNFEPVGTPNVDQKDTLQIKTVYYGGNAAKFAKRNKGKRTSSILNEIKKYIPVPALNKQEYVVSFESSQSSFAEPTSVQPFCTIADVQLYMLIGNASKERQSQNQHVVGQKRKKGVDGYALNTDSLVIALSFGGVQIVATGDATGVTLQKANKVLTQTIRQTYFPQVFMLTLPHHSSKTTTLDVRGMSGTPDEREAFAKNNLNEFAVNLNSHTITASADRKRGFNHPSALIMSYFWPYLRNKANNAPYYVDPLLALSDQHFYSAYFDRSDGFQIQTNNNNNNNNNNNGVLENWPRRRGNWNTVRTNQSVYVNLYYQAEEERGIVIPPNQSQVIAPYPHDVKQPPNGVAWVFGITANGAVELDRLDNREAPQLLHQKWISGRSPVIPPDITLDEGEIPECSPPEQPLPCLEPDVERQPVPVLSLPNSLRLPAGQVPLSRHRKLSILA